MNTTENNKIIANFLGRNGKSNKLLYAFKNLDHNGQIWFNETELRFHKDWNWLMQVVEKIESLDINKFSKQLGREDIKPIEGKFYLSIFDSEAEFLASVYYWQHDNNIKGLKKEKGSTKIEAVYNACLAFINWYNSQEAKEAKDLFQFYDEQPENVKSILAHFGDLEALTYEQCREMLLNLETIGYTFEFGTDAVPYNLRKI